MTNFLWRIVAAIVTMPAVTRWLIDRAFRTPYNHIIGPDGSTYMGRWWLFNPYPRDEAERERRKANPTIWDRLPSVRIHHIIRHDGDRHLHDHPWNARTIILRGWYDEERHYSTPMFRVRVDGQGGCRNLYRRSVGYTGRLLFGEYHRIREVPPEGVWTLFFTWQYQGTWGFLVNGAKVPWREYLGLSK
jgi:hypothetical protein